MPANEHETSKIWKIDGHLGKLGFISSMSDHFCGGCNRIRLTADGNFKVCLFDQKEVSLRDALRKGLSDEEITEIISKAIWGKKVSHSGMFEISNTKNRPMIKIGG